MSLKDKKVAVLGLGMEGLDLISYLLQKGALVTGFDVKKEEELAPQLKELKQQGLKLSLGKSYLALGLFDFAIVFRSPGVKSDLVELKAAQAKGVKVSSATQLFFDLCSGKIIGVTGTKGKGTTATLIHRILTASGKKSYLLGNIGQPSLAALEKIKSQDWVVYELSSFQLQDLTKSPHLAVVLFISSDHLDYHPSRKDYVLAKTAIVKFQTKKDRAVFNADDPTSRSFAQLTPAQAFYFSCQKKTNGVYIRDQKEIVLVTGSQETSLGPVADLKLLGRHNWENISAAIVAASLAGASPEAIKKTIFSFTGLPHRLELVGESGGVKFYNDSFSTTPETAMAAIKSFQKPIILIAGGSDKGADFTKLGQEIAKSSVKALVLIGQMADKIETAVKNTGFSALIKKDLKTMPAIVKAAASSAGSGEIVLLSPACASFGMFKNYKDRGDQFRQAVLKEVKVNG